LIKLIGLNDFLLKDIKYISSALVAEFQRKCTLD